ncbi:MAG: protein-export chaperone SecB [Thermodesulfovibrionales bacterium]|jgi:preprotein translocase subunit SecB
MAHKFRINAIRQIEAHFAVNPQYTAEEDKPIEISHSIEIMHQLDDSDLHVLVSLTSDSEKQPFRFAVRWDGVFHFDKVPRKDDAERFANINCAAILFPYIRESVADLIRRAGMPPLHVPPVNFVAMFEARQKTNVPKKISKTSKTAKL